MKCSKWRLWCWQRFSVLRGLWRNQCCCGDARSHHWRWRLLAGSWAGMPLVPGWWVLEPKQWLYCLPGLNCFWKINKSAFNFRFNHISGEIRHNLIFSCNPWTMWISSNIDWIVQDIRISKKIHYSFYDVGWSHS